MVDLNRWLRPHMANLPELDLFPDEASRNQAIDEIEQSMWPRSLSGLLESVVFVAGAFLLPLYIIEWAVELLFGNIVWRGWVIYPATIVAYCGIIFVLLRRDVPRDLRKQLLKVGVPVCLKCGYGLRGLSERTERCPECGQPFGLRVISILRQSEQPAKTEDDSSTHGP